MKFVLFFTSQLLGLLLVHGQKADVCNQKKETGRCLAYFPRFYFDVDKQQCDEFIYGGCGGNENNFASVEDCQNTCEKPDENEVENKEVGGACGDSVQRGPCRAQIPRWYYHSQRGQCARFMYGGCKGNRNNFNNLEECQKQCIEPKNTIEIIPQSKEQSQACSLSVNPGRCRGFFKRWFFNTESQQCERFVYGGCGGNKNNFVSKEECENSCGVSKSSQSKIPTDGSEGSRNQASTCSQDAARGPCRGNLIRWHFHEQLQRCQTFNYGGCGGNTNNFISKTDCEDSCDVCSLPLQPGPCNGQIARWSYNSAFGGCVPFLYGGCGGNLNNFENAVDCSTRCGPHSGRFRN